MTVILVTSITSVYATHTAFEALLALDYDSFILMVAITGVAIYSIEAGGYNVFDSHAS